MQKWLELLKFIILNVLFVDNFLLVGLLITIILYIIVFSDNIDCKYILLTFLGITILSLVAFLKLFLLIIYAKSLNKRAESSLVKTFYKKLKKNKKFRYVFLIIIFFPYIIGTLFNTIFNYNHLTQFVSTLLLSLCLSGLVPYLILFRYLDKKG